MIVKGHIGRTELGSRAEKTIILSVRRSKVQDWDYREQVIDHSGTSVLKIDAEHTISWQVETAGEEAEGLQFLDQDLLTTA